jgi:assimilatory nitrate reductase catalytic subunit
MVASATTATHCPYCSMQCGIKLAAGDGAPGLEPWLDFPTNRGKLCQKGWTAAELLGHPDRLTEPLLRDRPDDPLRPATWEEALSRVAGEVRRCQDRYGPASVGVFGGGGLTNEKSYLLGKFARVGLGTPNIDYNGRFCMSSGATAAQRAFGVDRGLPFPAEDIASADVVLLVGSNVAETMPPVMQYFDAQRNRGGRLIVVDPRATPTARAASLHLQVTPGTDLALANGLLNLVVKEGLVDVDFVARRTSGFDEARRVAASYWPDRVERITGVPVGQLTAATCLLGDGASVMVLTARGAEQHSKGTDTALGFINLALALGQAGKPYSGWGCITGQGNGQGGREHGQKADQLPGYRRIDDPAARRHVAGVWGVDPETLPGPGMSAYEMLDGLGTDAGVRALLIMGSNVVVSAPHAAHVQDRLDALDFLVVADLFLSETAARADVVLPSTQWAEEDGTMTNFEGRVLLRRAAFDPPAGVWTDLQILTALAGRLGRGELFRHDDARSVFNELRRASAGGIADYAGITYERIAAEQGVFWPCPDEGHPGTPRLFLDAFGTVDGRARFHPVHYRASAEEPSDDYPLYLTTGRVAEHYQSGTQTRRVGPLAAAVPSAFVEIHPQLAAVFHIADEDMVQVSTRRGTAVARARLTAAIRQDTLFMPFHWPGEGRANLLTNPALDPASKMPEFKVCAARIAKVPPR